MGVQIEFVDKTNRKGSLIMSNKQYLTIAALALALQTGGALAATLWNNGLPATVGPGGSNMSDTFQADDFTITVASDLTAVRFWDLESSASDYTGSIFYRIVNNAAGSPGSTAFGSGTVTPTRTAAGTALGLNVVQNDFAISILNLLPGTYWLELHNGPLGTTAFTDYYWSFADLNATNTPTNRGSELGLDPLATTWTTNDSEHAFVILGDPRIGPPGIPEPATMALAGVAMLLLAMRRKRTV